MTNFVVVVFFVSKISSQTPTSRW